MSGIENLIIAVEGFPCLWDPNHEDYFNRDMKESAWEQICREIHSGWDEFDGTMLINTCNSLKKKWTHIRDYYRKDLHKLENLPSGSKRGKQYKYAPFLEFLKPTIERLSESDNDKDTEKKPSIKNEEQDPLSPGFNDDSASSSQTTKTTAKVIKKRAKLLDMSERTQESQTATEDDDEKFLLSFRSDMRRMNDNQKLDFKIGMLQLVKKITFPQELHDS